MAFVAMGILGVTGCGPDNESEGKNAAAKEKDPGKPAAGSLPDKIVTQPKDNAGRAAMGPTGTVNQFDNKGKPANKPAEKKE